MYQYNTDLRNYINKSLGYKTQNEYKSKWLGHWCVERAVRGFEPRRPIYLSISKH